MPHITQIAAVELESGSSFNCYVVPKVPISAPAQQITGIVVSDSGSMVVKGEPVEAENITHAVHKFMTRIEDFPNVILVAHYGRRFDFPVLVSTLDSLDVISRCFGCVRGFIDSIEVFRKVFPNQTSYKQVDLARMLLQETYSAHNAIEDVEVLGKLMEHASMEDSDLMKHRFTPRDVLNQIN